MANVGGGGPGDGGGGGGGLPAALGAAVGPNGLAVDDVVRIIQAMQPAAGPERDIKLKCFDSGDPQEWLQWRARFVTIARCKNWDDAQQRRALSQSMSGKAIEATQHIRIEANAAAGLAALTAVQALDAYEAKFITSAGTTQSRSEFLAAAQTNGETLTQWHTRLATLYRRAHPAIDIETSHELIEKFCLGMWNATIAERTLTDQPATMTEALNHASRHAATRVTMSRRLDGARGHNRNLNAIKGPREAENKKETGEKDGGKKMATIRCFYCKKQGHPKKDCFAYQRAIANKQNNDSNNSINKRKFGRGGGKPGTRTGSEPSLNALASYLDAALAKEEEAGRTEPQQSEESPGNSGN